LHLREGLHRQDARRGVHLAVRLDEQCEKFRSPAASGAALCATASNRDGGLEAEILVLRHQLNLLRQRDCI
jgi:hypothetical protein